MGDAAKQLPVAALTVEQFEETIERIVNRALASNRTPVINRPLYSKEVAMLFGVSRGTVMNWMERGCPHMRTGRIIRFDRVAVTAWVAANAAAKPATVGID